MAGNTPQQQGFNKVLIRETNGLSFALIITPFFWRGYRDTLRGAVSWHDMNHEILIGSVSQAYDILYNCLGFHPLEQQITKDFGHCFKLWILGGWIQPVAKKNDCCSSHNMIFSTSQNRKGERWNLVSNAKPGKAKITSTNILFVNSESRTGGVNYCWIIPWIPIAYIGSMYGIIAYIWLIFMVN